MRIARGVGGVRVPSSSKSSSSLRASLILSCSVEFRDDEPPEVCQLVSVSY